MDDLKFDARAFDPAHVQALMREARRMRNEVLLDMVEALFDGRLATRLMGRRRLATPTSDDGFALAGRKVRALPHHERAATA